MRSTNDIANHSTDSGIRSTKRFDGARMIVCFGFYGKRDVVFVRNNASVAHKRTHHEWCINLVSCSAQLCDQRLHNRTIIGGDTSTKGFVRAMFAPGLGDHLKFNVASWPTLVGVVIANNS